MSSQRDSGPSDSINAGLVDAATFRRACSRFATGVTVVTTTGQDGTPHGLTVNSFSSVSLDPPLILVCLDARNQALARLLDGAAFAVNILADSQMDLSRRFSAVIDDRFEGVAWRPGTTGAPVLEGALGTFECRLWKAVEAGDHTVVVAKVEALAMGTGAPLVFFESGYRGLSLA